MMKSQKIIFLLCLFFLSANFFSLNGFAEKADDEAKMVKKINKEIEKGKGIMVVKADFYMDNQKGTKKFFSSFFGPSQILTVVVHSAENPKKEKGFNKKLTKFFAGYSDEPANYEIDRIELTTGYAPTQKYRGSDTIQEKVFETRSVPVHKAVSLQPDTIVYLGEIHVDQKSPGNYQLRYTFSSQDFQNFKNSQPTLNGKVISQKLFSSNKTFAFEHR